jgi:hypothetical protein
MDAMRRIFFMAWSETECPDGSSAPRPSVLAHAAKMDETMGESRGAMATTTPRSSPRSPSTMTKSPGLTWLGAAGDKMKHRWQRLNCTWKYGPSYGAMFVSASW